MTAALFLLFAGMGPVFAAADLARDLFEDGDWRGSRVEARRVLAMQPEHEEAQLLVLLSALRQGDHSRARLEALRQLAETTDDPEIRAQAAYELGRAWRAAGDSEQAFHHLRSVFRESPSREWFLLSGWSLHQLLIEHPRLMEPDDPLRAQLLTSRPLWTPAVRHAAEFPSESREKWVARAGRGVITLYQSHIAPGIGQRCSMHPSCSRYSHEALRRHGWMGLPMTADRLIREPDHVSQRLRPVIIDGRELYYDPVNDHDWWRRGGE